MNKSEAIKAIEETRKKFSDERAALESGLDAAKAELKEAKAQQENLIAQPDSEDDFIAAVEREARASARIRYITERLKRLDERMLMPDDVYSEVVKTIYASTKIEYREKCVELRDALQKAFAIAEAAGQVQETGDALIKETWTTLHYDPSTTPALLQNFVARGVAAVLSARINALDSMINAL